MKPKTDKDKLVAARNAIFTLLDSVDYIAGNCSQTQAIGAVLPPIIITSARKVLEETR